jgi:hypothetical protein
MVFNNYTILITGGAFFGNNKEWLTHKEFL